MNDITFSGFLALLSHVWPILATLLGVWVRIEIKLRALEVKINTHCQDERQRRPRSTPT